MKYLITGGAGFIGSHLAETLLKDKNNFVTIVDQVDNELYPKEEKIRNLKEISETVKHNNLVILQESINTFVNKGNKNKFDVVVNLAATPGLPLSWVNFSTYLKNNTEATFEIVKWAHEVNCAKFVQISTSSVYGKMALGDENSSLKPFSPYGVSKLAAENIVLTFFQNYNFNCSILRLFSVYGPRQRPDMAFNIFIKNILKGNEFEIFGDGSQSRTNSYISDITDGILKATNNSKPGEIYNLCGNESISINYALEVIQSVIGKKAKIKFAARRPGDQKETNGISKKAQLDFNFSASTSFEDGIQNQISWQSKID